MLTLKDLCAIPINPEALEQMPESVAREDIVLAVAVRDEVLHLILPGSVMGAELQVLESKLQFILNRSFTYDTANDDELARLIDLHYTAAYSTVQNCDRTFENRCPKRWCNLERTDTPRQRWCSVCERTVTFCLSDEELDRLASAGHCVAFCEGPTSVESVGLIEFPE